MTRILLHDRVECDGCRVATLHYTRLLQWGREVEMETFPTGIRTVTSRNSKRVNLSLKVFSILQTFQLKSSFREKEQGR